MSLKLVCLSKQFVFRQKKGKIKKHKKKIFFSFFPKTNYINLKLLHPQLPPSIFSEIISISELEKSVFSGT